MTVSINQEHLNPRMGLYSFAFNSSQQSPGEDSLRKAMQQFFPPPCIPPLPFLPPFFPDKPADKAAENNNKTMVKRPREALCRTNQGADK